MKFDLCLARDNAAKHHIEFFMEEETAIKPSLPQEKLQT